MTRIENLKAYVAQAQMPIVQKRAKIKAFEKVLQETIFKEHDLTETQKTLLASRITLLTKQARMHLGFPSSIHPAFLSKTAQNQLAKEITSMIHSVGAPWQPNEEFIRSQPETAWTFLHFVLGNQLNPRKILANRSAIKAVLMKKNPALMREARGLFQGLLTLLADDLIKHSPKKKEEIFHTQEIIGNLLSLYIYMDPQNGEVVEVPKLIDGKWEKVAYHTQKIQLTPSWMGSPIVALGLTAKNAPPQLIFKGTTYPADDGFLLSLLTDLTPMESVGQTAFTQGGKVLSHWLRTHTDNGHNPAEIYGQSLGGSLVQKAAIHFPKFIKTGFAYDPPGLSKNDLIDLRAQQRTNATLPTMHIICQHRDPVHYLDLIPKQGWNYWRIYGRKLKPGRIEAHASSFGLHKSAIITHLNPKALAHDPDRPLLTAFKQFLSFPLYGILLSIWCFNRTVAAIGWVANRMIRRQYDFHKARS